MAQDCYALFKTTYNQAIADGFASSVALAAAQAAQSACLAAQTQSPAQTLSYVVAVPGTRLSDPGPKAGEGTTNTQSRGAKLGQREK